MRLPIELIEHVLRHANHPSRVRSAVASQGIKQLLASGIRTSDQPRANGQYARTAVAGMSSPQLSAKNINASEPTQASVNRFSDGLRKFHAGLCKVARAYDHARSTEPKSRATQMKKYKTRYALVEKLFRDSGLDVVRITYGFYSSAVREMTEVNSNENSNEETAEIPTVNVKIRLTPRSTIEVVLHLSDKLYLASYKLKSPRGTVFEREDYEGAMHRENKLTRVCRPSKFWGGNSDTFRAIDLSTTRNALLGLEGVRSILHDIQLLDLALGQTYKQRISLELSPLSDLYHTLARLINKNHTTFKNVEIIR